jgi:hypothetical protein
MIHDGVAELLGSAIEGLAFSATTDEGNVFIDFSPSTPDRCVTVYTAPGQEADSKLPYDPVSFQVVVRCEAGSTWASTKWQEIYSYLHGRRYFTLPDGTEVVYIICQEAQPFRLQPDPNGRPLLSARYRAEVQNVTSQRGAL